VNEKQHVVGHQPADALLAFYDFPAEHWKHLRTTNVIESTDGSPTSTMPLQ
jgi:hypothetical protein